MKKFLLIILLFPRLLDAQTYVPFISTTDSTDTWLDVNSCTDLSCYETYVRRYKIDGDTVIGAYQYAKLKVKVEYEQGADQSQWCTESVTYWEYNYGSIRESGKQIFIKPDGAAEYLAYDFNLGIGDTVPSPANYVGSESARIIDSIDLVLVNGINRKRYLLNTGRYIVEGIGASSGLFNPLYQSSLCWFQMLCYTEDGTIEYFDENCNMNLAVEDLSLNNSEAELIKVVDFMGREIDETATNEIVIYLYSDGTSKKVFRVGD